jgi:hypothetical protein
MPEQLGFISGDNPTLRPFHLAIGRLAVIWSELEFSIDAAIWELANVEGGAGACMTSQMIGPGPRFRCLVALLNYRGVSQELIKSFNSLSVDTEAMGRQRNRYLHDPMVFNVEDQKVYRIETTADRKLKHDFVPLDMQAIADLTMRIDTASEELDSLLRRVVSETPAWPRTQYGQSPGIRREMRYIKLDNSPSILEHPQRPSSE